MHKSIPYKLSTTNDKFTSRSGLILIAEILRQMDVDKLANRHFPAPGSNRGFSTETYLRAFVLMRLEGGRCLEDIRHLKAEAARLLMLGMKRLPGADALGDWLRRMGQSRAGLRGLEALNRQLLKAALGTRRSVALDLDATAILCGQRETRYPDLKERGNMPMVGHIAEVGMIVSQQFRHSNVPPSKDNLGFIVHIWPRPPHKGRIVWLQPESSTSENYSLHQGRGHIVAISGFGDNCRFLDPRYDKSFVIGL